MRLHVIPFSIIFLACGSLGAIAQNNTPSYLESVPLSATITSTGIELNAPAQPGTTSYDVYRRLRNDSDPSWGTATNVTASPFIYTDAVDDQIYEYKVVRRDGPNVIGYGYICAGKDVPASEWSTNNDHFMGNVLLLVESTLASALPTASLDQLREDLRADGYKPLPTLSINANDTPAAVKAQIISAAQGNDVKAIILLGRIPVPLNHNVGINPDGHASEGSGMYNRLWPCDAYYGDLDGVWTLYDCADCMDLNNCPGPPICQECTDACAYDGIFNMALLPSEIEIPVGRIDFSDMTAFASGPDPLTEADLTASYIQRAHGFRSTLIMPKTRSIVFDDLFDYTLAGSGYRSFAPLTGNTAIYSGPPDLPDTDIYQALVSWGGLTNFLFYVDLNGVPNLNNEGSYLWTHGLSGGYPDGTGSYTGGSTEDLSDGLSNGGVFNLSTSSHILRWQTPDNFLRAKIATGNALTNVWSGNPHWYFHNMGIGEPIARSIRQSMNNSPNMNIEEQGYLPFASDLLPTTDDYLPGVPSNVHMAFMGDPTLRMHYVATPSALVSANANGYLHLTWEAAPDLIGGGYHVYKIVDDVPVLLNPDFHPSTSITFDGTNDLPQLTYIEGEEYMVRATKLEVTPSGSYWNLSLGVFGTNPPCSYTLDQTVHSITGSVIWDQNMSVRGSVVVQPGADLMIENATIRFADTRQTNVLTNIIVQPGAVLNIRNATLTSDDCQGPGMWDGIIVLANSYYQWDFNPYTSGTVNIYSGGIVRNALVGVDCSPMQVSQNGFLSGGIINSDECLFENNQIDIRARHAGLFWFENGNGPSSWAASMYPKIKNTTFRTTRLLNYPDEFPKTHVDLFGIGGMRALFTGNTFTNERTSFGSSIEMGHGIKAVHAEINVVPNSDPLLITGEPNIFRNLDHAIHATPIYGGPFTTVVGNTFTDNICGVYVSGETGITVRHNTIEMGKWFGVSLEGIEDMHFDGHHRGIFTTRSWGLNISDNTIARSGTAPVNSLLEGVVVGYTEDHNEVVFKNTASDLTIGFAGEGISADVNGGNPNSIGLQFQCNTNNGNATNLMSRKANGDEANEAFHTIRGIQGNPALAAGNKFDQNTIWDFDKNTVAVPNITYYYDPAFTDQQPMNHPTDVQPLAITGTGNACGDGPGGLVPGGGTITVAVLKPILSTSKYEYGTLRYQYEQLIDGGNTDEVVQEIISTWPQDIWDLRNYLLARSPYLSVQSLQELINKLGVPVAIKTEICVANPEATQKDGFLKWAEFEAFDPLPTYAVAAIRSSWDTRTYRFALEAQMAGKHTRMTQAANHLLDLYRTDSVRSHPDSLRWIWQQVRTNAARYAETGLLLHQRRYSDALALLDAMPQERELRGKEQTERQRMHSYVSVLANAYGAGRDEYRLNAQDVHQLEQLVGEHYDRPAVWASNLLCAQYRICRSPYTGGSPTPKSLMVTYLEGNGEHSAFLKIHPNPATTWASFNYHLPGNSGDLQVSIRDAQGRMIHTMQAAGEKGQLMWDTRGKAPGIYTIELLRNGLLEHTGKLVIQP